MEKTNIKTNSENLFKIFSINSFDLIFQLELTDNEMKKIEDINSIKDLEKIKDLKFRFNLKGGNETLNQLLIANQVFSKIYVIDYISYNIPRFEKDISFFNKIFKFVTLKNHIFINNSILDKDAPFTFIIELIYNEQKMKLIKYEKKEMEEEMKKESEEENENIESPTINRKESILCNIKPKFKSYNMIYINYKDIKQIPGDFKMEDFFDLLKYYKNKGSFIFINFYKPIKNNNSKDNKIEKDTEYYKEKYYELNELSKLAQIFFFVTEQAEKIFQKHYKYYVEDNQENVEKIKGKELYNYFNTKFLNKSMKQQKIGLFLDNFELFTICLLLKSNIEKIKFPEIKINNKNKNKNHYYNIFISFIIYKCATLNLK